MSSIPSEMQQQREWHTKNPRVWGDRDKEDALGLVKTKTRNLSCEIVYDLKVVYSNPVYFRVLFSAKADASNVKFKKTSTKYSYLI